MSMKEQFLWLTFAPDDAQGSQALHYVKKELQQLRIIFSKQQVFFRKKFFFNFSERIEGKELGTIIDEFDKKLTVLHFSGHASGKWLKLENNKFSSDQLDRLLTDSDHLQLVFLNACSTEEVMEHLKEQGVKCIIYTGRDVKDELAYEVSKSFYTNLFNGKSIEEAFQKASSRLKGTMEAIDAGGTRGGLKIKSNIDGKFPFHLFWQDKKFAEEVLFPAEAAELEISPEKKELMDKLEAAMAEMEKLQGFYQQAPSDDMRDYIGAQYKKQLEDAEALSLLLLSDTNALQLKTAFTTLNFIPQQDFLDEKSIKTDGATERPQLPSGVYLIRGTESCGLGLFVPNFADRVGVNLLLQKPERIDFKSLSQAPNIWTKISAKLLGNELEMDAAEIAQQVAAKYKLTASTYPLVLLLDNIHRWDQDMTRLSGFLKSFWEPLHTHFTRDSDRKIYLLLIDRGVTVDKDFGQPVPRNYEDYLETTDAVGKEYIFLPPQNEKLTAEEFKMWCRSQPSLFGQKISQWKEFLDQSHRIKPTLLKVINNLWDDNETKFELENHLFILDNLKDFDS